jgi:hypothetical protein
MLNITFTNTLNVPEEYSPKPATASVPEWYKELPSYMAGEKKPTGDGSTTGTIKRCMPVFDAITGGYILYTYTDIWVSKKDEQLWYEWPSFNPISWHPIEQAPNHPNRNGHQESYPKWINPWSIQTPLGYSTLFVQPFHRESLFTILPGVVDTDQYNAPVNFPFVLNDTNYEGLIPAGTPMAQVIPFKRDSWEMNIGTQEDFDKQNKTSVRLRTRFFDSYKSQFRQLKEYK